MDSTDLYQKTKSLLKQDNRLISEDGEILKNKCIELVLNQDLELVNLLLSKDEIKDKFFTEVGDAVVFQEDKFIQFLDNYEFLDESYTQFKNKIGLKSSKGHISEQNQTEIVWPYKDCVLEAGQTDEKTSRREKFWNKTLNPGEVDRLTSPKVLTGFYRQLKSGRKEVNNVKSSDNLFIRGNNLLALYSLLPVYREDVKLIYLDPPYNTGNDSFKYNDNFNHSTWLTFMKNRLEVSKKFLQKDGAIVVQCDDNEQAYLKVLMDEIFGEENFVNCVSVQMSNLSGPKMAHVESKIPKLKEYLLIYKKSDDFTYNVATKQKEEWDDEYSWFLEGFSKKDYEVYRENNDFDLLREIAEDINMVPISDKIAEVEPTDEEQWKRDNSYRIVRSSSGTAVKKAAEAQEAYKQDSDVAAIKSQGGDEYYLVRTDYTRDVKTPRLQLQFAEKNMQQPVGDIWTDFSTSGLAPEGGVTFKNGKKPERLLKRIIEMITDKEDTVMDFFLGSGTTAAVSHKLNRQYIGIEQMNYGDDDPTVRLENVINGDPTGISEEVNWEGGGSFVYAELKKLNSIFLEYIQSADSNEELIELWNDIQDEAFLSYTVNLSKFDEEEFQEFSIENKKSFLREVLDYNQLYLNYSEIEDRQYQVTEDTKELNDNLYNIGD